MGSTFFSKRYNPETKRLRKKRPKSFKTAEAAKAWGQKNLKEFTVKQLTYSNKFIVC